MEKLNKDIFLHTAFSCMACDGDIDPKEVQFIKKMDEIESLFGEIELDKELSMFTDEINKKGKLFLKEYFQTLADSEFSEAEELKILRIAALTIQADEVIQYSEIKFFKVIRSYMKVSDEKILAAIKELDETYLAQDIVKSVDKLQSNYFDSLELPTFNTDFLSLNLE